MDWRVGTIGFAYDDWRGPFYPSSVKQPEQLAFYARQYDCVEIDSTFHAVPPPERFEKWAAATPDGFRFVLKAPKAITHEGVISDAADSLRSFVHAARPMGEKLACVLIQYPAVLPGRVWPSIEKMLSQLPADVRFALEVRNSEFFRDEVYDGLRKLNVALVTAEYEVAPREPIATADFALARLIGKHGAFEPMDHERFDPHEKLIWWRDKLGKLPIDRAFVMLNNDYAGYAIATADAFKRLVGQSVTSEAERRGTLF